MSKVYSVLPSKREELDDVLAFLYLGPTKSDTEHYKWISFLVYCNKVINALE